MITNIKSNTNNALKSLKNNQLKMAKASTKLSSGLKINSAADNASGLGISEKMKAQIRGLSQAQRNIEDGISLTQVADAGMNEIHNILQRARELSVQSANDTSTENDKECIQEEINSLLSEIDSITDNTEFNNIKLLKGSGAGSGATSAFKETIVGKMPDWVKVPNQLSQVSAGSFIKNDGTVIERKISVANIDFSAANANNMHELIGNGFYSTCCTCTEKYSIKFVDTPPKSTASPNPIIEIDISKVKSAAALVQTIETQAMAFMNHFTQITVDQNSPTQLQIIDPRTNAVPNVAKELGIVGAGIVETTVNNTTSSGSQLMNIQLGPNSGDTLKLELPNTSIETLNVNSLIVTSQKDSSNSISRLDDAISKISRERSKMGSYQNRLSSSYNNAANYEENLQASESRIRDTDMAKSMMEYSKFSILCQAAQSMLAQTNNSMDSIKSLLTM